MKNIALRGTISKQGSGYYIHPATKSDALNLDLFTTASNGKYITIQMKSSTGTKTLKQLNTAYALISMCFVAKKGRKPTKSEKQQMHDELCELFSDKKEVQEILGESTKKVFTPLSEMSKEQMSRFIQSLIQWLYENTQQLLISPDDLVDLQILFFEWQSYLSLQEYDPTDFDKNGEYLTLEEYKKTHTISYASGRTCDASGGGLEIAHIVSRGSAPMFEQCCWNVMMLTHEEHIEIMHEEGWNSLIARFPHIRGRVERAYNLARHLYKIINEEGIDF